MPRQRQMVRLDRMRNVERLHARDIAPDPEVIPFHIERGLDDIPEPEPCPLCGGITEKALLMYGVRGAKVVVETDSAPGYQCTHCGAQLYDPGTDIMLLTKAAELLDAPEDAVLRDILYASAQETCDRLANSDVIAEMCNIVKHDHQRLRDVS